MIYWLQEATEAGAQGAASSSPSATLTGAVVGAVVGLVGVLIGQVLQQRRHSQTLRDTQRRHSEDLRQAEQGQITERFTRAIDQLGATDDKGKPKLEIRLGGIYGLERIAWDSPQRDYRTVMEVLTAYVRENVPTARIWYGRPQEADEYNEPLPYLPRADIQAVMQVLRRRGEFRLAEEHTLYQFEVFLQGLHLRGVDLKGADLKGAILGHADLSGADLSGADLRETDLRGADLQEANLIIANLEAANLEGANLRGANLAQAALVENSEYQPSIFRTNLQGADFRGADLSNLQGFQQGFAGTAPSFGAESLKLPIDRYRSLVQERIEAAIGDETTKLPEGLSPPASWTQGEDGQPDKR